MGIKGGLPPIMKKSTKKKWSPETTKTGLN